MGEWKALANATGTGWKEIYREPGTGGWKSLQIAGSIDVGDSCINRADAYYGNWTRILKGNPANASGTLTSICIYMNAVQGDTKVGIFYVVSGSTLKCRSAANLGVLSIGENNKAGNLAIETNDYIGFYTNSTDNNKIDGGGGGAGIWAFGGDTCIVDNQTEYTFYSDYAISMYGTG